MLQQIPCSLFEPDGTLLAAGTATFSVQETGAETVITGLDRPGRVVQRCLVGGVSLVQVRLGGAAPVAARVERVSYDAKLGRSCTIRVA